MAAPTAIVAPSEARNVRRERRSVIRGYLPLLTLERILEYGN
jgi:hypothetical protein